MALSGPAETIWKTVGPISSLGFVPVAIHFRLFEIVASSTKPTVSGLEVHHAYVEKDPAKNAPPVKLIQDTLIAMTGLDWIDRVDEDIYKPNAVTKHLATTPSALHGVLHFTTEVLMASSFLSRKLATKNFTDYPFDGLNTPIQYAHYLMGNINLATQHTYSIMAAEGRMPSFNTFMTGRFGRGPKAPEQLRRLGYNLESVVTEAISQGISPKMVDIGGGRGELMLEIKEAIPRLTDQDLIVEEFNPDITDIPGLTLIQWDYSQEKSPQPVHGALIYHLSAVLHNLPDLAAARLLQKTASAMAPHSRLLIHERDKAVTPNNHTAMIVLYGGRERSNTEWHQLAALAGLKVTFEEFPVDMSRGVVEMMKL